MSTEDGDFSKTMDESEDAISERPFECILDDSSSDEDTVSSSQVRPEVLQDKSPPQAPSEILQEESPSQVPLESPQDISESHVPLDVPEDKSTSGLTSRGPGRKDLSDEDVDEIILSITWVNGRVGAAYYNIVTSELFVMEDIIEDEFNYCITRSLYKQCEPRYVITSSGSPDAFINILKKLIIKDTADTSFSSSSCVDQASQVVLKILPKNANTFDDCINRVNLLKLRSEPKEMSNTERIIFLQSVLNYTSRVMIHALGMLLKYIDTNWGKIALDPKGDANYLYINYIRLQELVMIEEETFKELNIMQSKYHPSLFKFGMSIKHERMSLFTLLNRCQSRIGVKYLWRLMQQPTRNIRVLQERFRVTEFFLNPDHTNIFESLRKGLKNIVRLTPALLNRYSTPLAKPYDWKKLSRSFSSVIHIGELCDIYRDSADVFRKVADSITRHMHQSRYFIDLIVDHEMSKKLEKFTVRAGVDNELDELNAVKRSLPDMLAKYVEKDLQLLPNSVKSAKLIYLPDILFLLGITEWVGDSPAGVEIEGMEFKCCIGGIRHYKSATTRELDESVGDIQGKIHHRQSIILMKLISFIDEDIGSLLKSIECCAELDALMSLSTVARGHNYTQPKMVKCHVIDIKDGRHPLQELSSQYVPNDTQSGEDHSLIKIFSGPNACGKTAYMKQTALIVYMAHIGCYVPASSARIGVITNFLMQVPSIKSNSYNASSFLVDLRQVNSILYSSTPNSLILMDEFGRGTAERDGLSLLAGIIYNFIKRKNYCPHVFVATHIHRIHTVLPPDPIFEMQMFDYMLNEENNALVFLYKVIPGCVKKSFAHQVARSMKLQNDVLAEAVAIFEIMTMGQIPGVNPEDDGRVMMRRIANLSNGQDQPGKIKDFIRTAMARKT
nr:PREDICTED: mutS protein homolog 5-like [Fopius arisanus]